MSRPKVVWEAEGRIKFKSFSFAAPPRLFLRPISQTIMHSALLVLLSFLGLYILQSLLEFRRAIRSVGWAPSPLQRNNEITESSFGSLSGPRVLITPLSPLGQLIRLVLPPFRYIIPDRSWVIKNGNRGRDMPGQEIICESLSYADFAAAGQDALAMVGLLYSVYGGARLNDRGLPGLRVAPTSEHLPCGCGCNQSKGHSASN